MVLASYEGLKSLKALLLPCNWDYGILDEGQRIRNPDAEVRCLAINTFVPRRSFVCNLLLKDTRRLRRLRSLSPAVRVGIDRGPQITLRFVRRAHRDDRKY